MKTAALRRTSLTATGLATLLVVAALQAGCNNQHFLGTLDSGAGPTGSGGSLSSDSGTHPPSGGSADAHILLSDGAPPSDTGGDAPGSTQVGPSYACGPSSGLKCSCGLQPYFPAPINDAGQQQTFVLPPDPATVVAYATQSQFDALAVGQWRRTAGESELVCEQVGVEFTVDHRLIPLVIASNGSIQPVTALATSVVVSFADPNFVPAALIVDGGSLSTSAPTFFDNGQSMYFNYAPWPADYVRLH